ncbi:uncharacterized protein LOC114765065 [Denticeps clupeoides]|uniref:uncharacterized protein LOC114765065 n=1 Tax=Denticeps clupeoides TaxID=299321 RepID=UPI0010A310A2|nr:uncharacterized protein LOC114765065 [Denticeps clupeoides]
MIKGGDVGIMLNSRPPLHYREKAKSPERRRTDHAHPLRHPRRPRSRSAGSRGSTWQRRSRPQPIQELTTPSCYLSFITKAVLWDKDINHNTGSNTKKSILPSLCPRFVSHMKSFPANFRPHVNPEISNWLQTETSVSRNIDHTRRWQYRGQSNRGRSEVVVPRVPALNMPSSERSMPLLPHLDTKTNFRATQPNINLSVTPLPPLTQLKEVADVKYLKGEGKKEEEDEDKKEKSSSGLPNVSLLPNSPYLDQNWHHGGQEATGDHPASLSPVDSLSDFSRPPSSQFSRCTDLSSGPGSSHSAAEEPLSSQHSGIPDQFLGATSDATRQITLLSRPSQSVPDIPAGDQTEWTACSWMVLPPITTMRGPSVGSSSSQVRSGQSDGFADLEAVAPHTASCSSQDHPDSSEDDLNSPATDLSPGLAALTMGCDSGGLGSLSRVQLLMLDRPEPQETGSPVDQEWGFVTPLPRMEAALQTDPREQAIMDNHLEGDLQAPSCGGSYVSEHSGTTSRVEEQTGNSVNVSDSSSQSPSSWLPKTSFLELTYGSVEDGTHCETRGVSSFDHRRDLKQERHMEGLPSEARRMESGRLEERGKENERKRRTAMQIYTRIQQDSKLKPGPGSTCSRFEDLTLCIPSSARWTSNPWR